MSWHFSAALAAEFLEVTSSDGAPSAQSSGCNTLGPSSCNDKMTESCDHSQSGTMSRPSTGAPGLDAWMLSRVGFRARTSPQQEKERESTANAPGCGRTWHESLAKYDPDSRSWKTAQCSLLAGLDEFSETWPRWGTMRNGACWARMTAEHLTGATESGLLATFPTPTVGMATGGQNPEKGGQIGLGYMARKNRWPDMLPTPLASIATHSGPNQRDSSGRPGLQMMAMRWPTPLSGEESGGGNARYALAAMNGEKRASGATRSLKLRDAVLAFPTPAVNDAKNSTLPPSQKDRDSLVGDVMRGIPTPRAGDGLKRGAIDPMEPRNGLPGFVQMDAPGGQLNPPWVEWLMGWPIGWTDSRPLEMDKFQSWRQVHSGSCPLASEQ